MAKKKDSEAAQPAVEMVGPAGRVMIQAVHVAAKKLIGYVEWKEPTPAAPKPKAE